ncbi:Acetyltransferase [Tepidimonas alkaliphilus]|uniref:Acetyltransferase n=1 Tax=Tepidimonas alkaliphilus TaxID=2588942 RepID=A0A554WDT4_9BURK|nr:YbgC/FadM family acyl-CoA thioesterase [Tepidimonas alkaliphilus]TSE21726.1 Acetyltransferase [Tepidimonas alkaliphilus]
MKRQEYRCRHRLRVRWSEVDRQGIVFNAHYLTYIDVGVSHYWRQLGLPYSLAMPQLGGEPVMRKATLEYAAPAQLDDELEVALRCERLGRTSWTMRAALFRGERALATAELVYVWVNLAAHAAQPIPAALRELFERFEAGGDVLRVETGSWSRLQALAAPLRRAVFVEEQGIPEQEEWDEADAEALHAVAVNALGQAVGAGRLLRTDEPGVGKIGRMAVHRALRGSGIGARVLEALVQAARERGDHTLRLSAQRTAVGFYARHGWRPVGEPHEEVGIPHQWMERRLTDA